MAAYEDMKPTLTTAYFGEVLRAYFSGNDLQFDVDGGTPVTVATLTSPRCVGIHEDADGSIRLLWIDDAGTGQVQYLSRMRGQSGSWSVV